MIKRISHAHIRYFIRSFNNEITDIPSNVLKLMLFPFSLEGLSPDFGRNKTLLSRSILNEDDLVSNSLINFLFKKPNLGMKYEIFNKDLTESINESKSKVRNSRNKAVVVNTMAMFIETTFKSTFHKLLQPILIKEIPISSLDVSNLSVLLVFLFPPIQNNQNRFNQNQGNNFNQNRGTNFNQNRGNNFNQGQVYQPPTNQPPVYQAPTQQMQGVSKTDFENYVKANDAVLRNMQNQGQGLQNQMINLTEMISKFINSNTASSLSLGTLPSKTVTNPREHVNAITTLSGKTCEGPSTPLVPTSVVSTPLKEPERNPETSMDKVQKSGSESTAQVPPPEDHDSIFIEIPKP
ncbi:hypothetical protein Tco_1157472, partial [Tanacetum coccineum]